MFNIENFPTSESAQRMLSRVSPIYENSYVGKWLFEVMGFELDEAREIVESIRKQCFVEQCTWAIGYWEQCFGIESDESLDIETRRSAVIAKRGYKRPMSPAAMEDFLETLTGQEVTVTENNSEYRFSVSILRENSALDQQILIKQIQSIKPSHLSFDLSVTTRKTAGAYVGGILQGGGVLTLVTDVLADSDYSYLTDESGNVLADENGAVLLIAKG